MDHIEIPILRIDPLLPLPSYAHDGDAGLDLRSSVDVVLQPFQRALIPTGFAVAIPEGYAGFVQPRSGLALKNGFTLANTPGLIDSHFRGELKVIGINLDPDTPFRIERGERIAQLVVQRVERVALVEAAMLAQTGRGAGGFGSTGTV